jgi:hypothetical protein
MDLSDFWFVAQCDSGRETSGRSLPNNGRSMFAKQSNAMIRPLPYQRCLLYIGSRTWSKFVFPVKLAENTSEIGP